MTLLQRAFILPAVAFGLAFSGSITAQTEPPEDSIPMTEEMLIEIQENQPEVLEQARERAYQQMRESARSPDTPNDKKCQMFLIGGEYQEAAKPCMAAAKAGYPLAQYNMGWMYLNAKGVKQDLREAFVWFRKAAEQNEPTAQFNMGAALEVGDEKAGIPQNIEAAVQWYTKSANQGNSAAQYNLGTLYDNGKGVPQDPQKSVEFYRQSAEQGYPPAQFSLGVAYYLGEGIEQNDVEAYAWFNIIAETGNPTAKAGINALEKRMSTEQIEQAKLLTQEYKKKYSGSMGG